MKKDKLNEYVSGIDDAFISESASERGGVKVKKSGIIVSAMKIAACFLLAVGITAAAVFLPQMRKPGAGGGTDVTGSDVTSGDNAGIGHDSRYIGFTAHDVSRCFPYYPQTYSGLLYRVATKDVTGYTANVISNVADLDDYIDRYQSMMKNEPEHGKPDPEALAEIRNRYDESYFENRDLIFLPVRDATINVTFRIMSLTVKGGAVTLDVSYYDPGVGDGCEQQFCAAIETGGKLKCDSVNVNFRSEAGQNPTPDGNCRLVWSRYNSEKAEFGNSSSFIISEFDNAVVEIDQSNYSININGKRIAYRSVNQLFSLITDLYLFDITGDGIPEMCFNIEVGSGYIDSRIAIAEYSSEKVIFSMSDRLKHDYRFVKSNDNTLCIVERDEISGNDTRTGTLTYNGSNVSVDWGSCISSKAYYFNINTLTDVSDHPFTVLRSRSDIENYLVRYSQTEKDYIELKNCLDSYGEEFFRSNHIVIISTTVGKNLTYSGVQLTESWNSLYAELLTEESGADSDHGITPITVVIPIGGQLADNPTYNFN